MADRAEATTSGTDARRLAQSALADDVEFLLARARSVGTMRANRHLAELGLRVRDYAALSLAASDLHPSQRELAEYLSLDPSQIVALIDGLEARGLVVREPHASDRRLRVIDATAEGHRVYRQARELAVRAEEESLGALDVAERELLRDLLRRLAFPA
ncbi:MAG: MarR family transcriptional regulator [Microbacterium sp.]